MLPRHYREDSWVLSFRSAVAYAVTVAGMELDPLALRCFLTGTYDISIHEAEWMVNRFMHVDGQKGISDFNKMRDYVRNVVEKDADFIMITNRLDLEKVTAYQEEAHSLAVSYDFPSISEVSMLSIKHKYGLVH